MMEIKCETCRYKDFSKDDEPCEACGDALNWEPAVTTTAKAEFDSAVSGKMKHECKATRGFIMKIGDSFGDAILHESVLKHHGSKIKFSVRFRTGKYVQPCLEFDRVRTTPCGNFFIDDELVPINFCPFCGERLSSDAPSKN